jgi:hypothetical protein
MLIDYTLGQTSIVFRVKIRNSSVSTGAGLTGLSSTSSGMIISTIADVEATATPYTVAASNVQAVATLGTYAAPASGKVSFSQVDATNHPGIYEIQIANARFAVANAKSLLVSITGATNAADCDVVIPLRTVNPYANNFGLTPLPTAAAGAAGGLHINGANTGPLSVSGGVTYTNSGGDAFALTSSGGNGNGLNATGNGTGSGMQGTGGATGHGVNAVGGATSGSGFRGIATTSGDGIHAGGAGAFHGVNFIGGATGNGMNLTGGATSGAGLNITTTVGAGISVAPTSGNALTLTGNAAISGTTTFTGVVTASAGISGNITGNLSGTVGSVTGAVGSVTGLTTATIATAVLTDITSGDLGTSGSIGYILTHQLGEAFTSSSSSVFTGAALANAPTGGSAPTVAEIATGVWQDVTAGDFTVPGSIGKSLFTSGNAPGTAGGLFLAGTGGIVPAGAITSSSFAAGAINQAAVAANALSSIVIETGFDLPQAICAIAAACVGTSSGFVSGTPTYTGMGNSTPRVTAPGAANGNRPTVTLSLPAI